MPRNDEAHWAELMRRAQAGDAPAYASLLTELGDAISSYLYRRFGAVDFAEDCVQDSLMAIHEARHTFIQGRPFRPWLFAIVRNRAIDQLRREAVRSRLFDAALDASALSTASAADDSEREARTARAGSVLDSLKPQHREALTLTKLKGFSIAEAAGQIGISQSAMKVRVHRATRAAAKLLEAQSE
jgi:RNA polymerase sigma-70 factor, ECF subfamily